MICNFLSLTLYIFKFENWFLIMPLLCSTSISIYVALSSLSLFRNALKPFYFIYSMLACKDTFTPKGQKDAFLDRPLMVFKDLLICEELQDMVDSRGKAELKKHIYITHKLNKFVSNSFSVNVIMIRFLCL